VLHGARRSCCKGPVPLPNPSPRGKAGAIPPPLLSPPLRQDGTYPPALHQPPHRRAAAGGRRCDSGGRQPSQWALAAAANTAQSRGTSPPPPCMHHIAVYAAPPGWPRGRCAHAAKGPPHPHPRPPRAHSRGRLSAAGGRARDRCGRQRSHWALAAAGHTAQRQVPSLPPTNASPCAPSHSAVRAGGARGRARPKLRRIPPPLHTGTPGQQSAAGGRPRGSRGRELSQLARRQARYTQRK